MVAQHREYWKKLPDGEWTTKDVQISRQKLYIGRHAGIIKKVGETDRYRGDYNNIYELDERAKELLENTTGTTNTICPCSCRQDGVRNLKHGGYACPVCGQEFDREELNT